jgi:hypothetical protein
MFRTALITVAAFAAAAPAFAQAPVYRAVPVVQAAETVIAGETLWRCGADGCTTSRATSRPAIVCAQAASKVGKLDSFVVNGQAFDAEALAKCNARARG